MSYFIPFSPSLFIHLLFFPCNSSIESAWICAFKCYQNQNGMVLPQTAPKGRSSKVKFHRSSPVLFKTVIDYRYVRFSRTEISQIHQITTSGVNFFPRFTRARTEYLVLWLASLLFRLVASVWQFTIIIKNKCVGHCVFIFWTLIIDR